MPMPCNIHRAECSVTPAHKTMTLPTYLAKWRSQTLCGRSIRYIGTCCAQIELLAETSSIGDQESNPGAHCQRIIKMPAVHGGVRDRAQHAPVEVLHDGAALVRIPICGHYWIEHQLRCNWTCQPILLSKVLHLHKMRNLMDSWEAYEDGHADSSRNQVPNSRKVQCLYTVIGPASFGCPQLNQQQAMGI